MCDDILFDSLGMKSKGWVIAPLTACFENVCDSVKNAKEEIAIFIAAILASLGG